MAEVIVDRMHPPAAKIAPSTATIFERTGFRQPFSYEEVK